MDMGSGCGQWAIGVWLAEVVCESGQWCGNWLWSADVVSECGQLGSQVGVVSWVVKGCGCWCGQCEGSVGAACGCDWWDDLVGCGQWVYGQLGGH